MKLFTTLFCIEIPHRIKRVLFLQQKKIHPSVAKYCSNIEAWPFGTSLLHLGHSGYVNITDYVIIMILTKADTRFHFSEFNLISIFRQSDCSFNKYSAVEDRFSAVWELPNQKVNVYQIFLRELYSPRFQF